MYGTRYSPERGLIVKRNVLSHYISSMNRFFEEIRVHLHSFIEGARLIALSGAVSLVINQLECSSHPTIQFMRKRFIVDPLLQLSLETKFVSELWQLRCAHDQIRCFR